MSQSPGPQSRLSQLDEPLHVMLQTSAVQSMLSQLFVSEQMMVHSSPPQLMVPPQASSWLQSMVQLDASPHSIGPLQLPSPPQSMVHGRPGGQVTPEPQLSLSLQSKRHPPDWHWAPAASHASTQASGAPPLPPPPGGPPADCPPAA